MQLEGFKLLGDLPDRGGRDPLGFDAIARDLTAILMSSRSAAPFTLGIEGGWGTGKSSLMARIEENLQEHSDVKTVIFNAWTAGDGDALEGLIKSVLNQLDRSVLRRLARKKRLVGWGRLTARIFAAWLGVARIVDELWAEVSADPRARNELKLLLEQEMKARFDSPGRSPGDRLLAVFVDDLDRCSPTNVFQVFEAMKLYLALPGIVFIVGYDKDVVSESILSREQYSPTIKSQEYLDKIIQVVYRMPRPQLHAGELLIERCLDASGTSHLFDASLRSVVLDRNARNPRRIKRFVNSFVTHYRLDSGWAEVGPSVLARVLILYMYFPEFATLFSAGSRSDPVARFIDYQTVQAALRARSVDDDVRELLNSFDVRAPEDGAIDCSAARHELDEVVPACFKSLVRNGEFLSVLEGLREADVRERLISQLEGNAFAAELPALPVSPNAAQPLPDPTGPYPYRLRLTDVVPAEAVSEITARGELVFHTAGHTGSPKNPKPQLAVAAALADDTPGAAFLYLLGDLVYYYGEREQYYSQFYQPYASYPAPIFAIPGNHDGSRFDESSEPSLAAFIDNFCASKADLRPEAGDTKRSAMIQPHVHWTLEAPYLTLIGLYTNVNSGGSVGSDQIEWLVDELRDASADCALVLAMHHACYSCDAYHRGSQKMSDVVDEVVRRAGRTPDVVIAAGVNNYQRFTRTVGSCAVPYLVVGAGGYHRLHRMAKGSDGDVLAVPRQVREDLTLERYCDDRHGYLRVSATPTALRCDYVAVETKDTAIAEVLDSFVVEISSQAT